MLNVVILCGGRGGGSIVPTLLDRQGLHVTAVVNAYDDGKSTGEIRRFFGMLGPSDIRKVQELMLPKDNADHDAHQRLFQYRFPADAARDAAFQALRTFVECNDAVLGGAHLSCNKVRRAVQHFLSEFLDALHAIEQECGGQFNFGDCSIMNCIYAGAFVAHDRNIESATLCIDRLFKLRGDVLPTSIEDKKLVALRENGQMLYSEAEIVELRSNVRIERIYLLDRSLDRARFEPLSTSDKRYYLEKHHSYVGVSPRVRQTLQQADIIIYAPGTQHSSLYPTYMSVGLAEAIADNHQAFKVFITNIGADYETPSYKASDYLRGALRYLNLADKRQYQPEELVDVCLVNQSRLKADETYVDFDPEGYVGLNVERVVDHFESESATGKHDGRRVVQTILDLYDAPLDLR